MALAVAYANPPSLLELVAMEFVKEWDGKVRVDVNGIPHQIKGSHGMNMAFRCWDVAVLPAQEFL